VCPPTMRVGVIYHCDQTTDRLDEVLAAQDAEVARYRLDQGDDVPATTPFDAVIVLGGAMGAYDTAEHPWLEDEKAWLQTLATNNVPVLGICLGSQLLADVLGGRAFLSPGAPEAGVIRLELTAAGRADRVLRYAGTGVFSLHQDTFELPPGAKLLGLSADYPQAFRYGSVLAIQFHPDADAALAVEWAKEMAPFLTGAGVELADYERDLEAAEPYLARTSRRIFQAFLEAV
jgi:GMP synthase (glutamine-hydrolysing)